MDAFIGKNFNVNGIKKEVDKVFALNPNSQTEYVGILNEEGHISEVWKFNRMSLIEDLINDSLMEFKPKYNLPNNLENKPLNKELNR